MSSLIPSIAALGLAALAALFLALHWPSPAALVADRALASRALAIATAVQAVHFAEELVTDFHIRFPALFGLDPMPLPVFVAFNLLWIVIWLVSIPLLRSGRRAAFFAAWFLAIAGMLNGLAHPLFAAVSGGYFPGLFSSFVVGPVSVWLSHRLRNATRSAAG